MRQIKMLLWVGIALLLYQSPLFAQAARVTNAEYFIDADPGYGNGKPIPVSSDTAVSVTISIPTTGLSEGFHTLFVRAKNDRGAWGLAEARGFYLAPAPAPVSPVSAVEYFVDQDPGYGRATALTATAGDTVALARSISTAGLAPGFHTLFVRAQNQKGTWGLADARVFYLAQPVTVSPLARLEYFYDQDPGYGKGTDISISQADSVMLTKGLPTQGLALGNHTLVVRAQNAAGVWGMGEARTFKADEKGAETPAISVSTTSLAFGEVQMGQSRALTFAVGNTGNAPLTVSDVTVSGTGAGDFTVAPKTFTVNAGATPQTLTVTFRPSSIGAKSAVLSIAHNAAGTPSTVALSGTGTPAGLASDFDGDGDVDFDDFFLFAAAFGTRQGQAGFDAKFDLSGNGAVDFDDFFTFAGDFGKTSKSSKATVSRPGVNARASLSVAAVASDREMRARISASNATQIRGYILNVSYDPSALAFVRAERGTDALLSRGGPTPLFLAREARPGQVAIADVIADGGTASGDGSLADLIFRRIGAGGEATVRVDVAQMFDGSGGMNLLDGTVENLPSTYALSQNYPNPFNPSTTIRYTLPEASDVRLVIYNALGQEVRALVQGRQEAGYYRVTWDGRDAAGRQVSSGLYFYRLTSGNFAETRKMLLLK